MRPIFVQTVKQLRESARKKRGTSVKNPPKLIRAARVQNETAPEKLLNRYEKRFEKREKGSEKTMRKAFEKVLALSGRLKIFHRHFSTNFKSFSPPKVCTKKKVIFHRGALQGWPR